MSDETPDVKGLIEAATDAKVTAEDVEANRLRNLVLPGEKKEKLRSLMRPQLLGLLTPEEYQDFRAYWTTFRKELFEMESLKMHEYLHDPLTQLMLYSVECECDGGMLFLNLFKHYSKNPTKKQLEDAYFFAWIESVYFGVYFPLDDFVDGSQYRRFESTFHVEIGSEKATMLILTVFAALAEVVAVKFGNRPFGSELLQRFLYFSTSGTAAQALDALGHGKEDKMWDLAFREEHNRVMLAPVIDLPIESAAMMTGYDLTPAERKPWKSIMYDVGTLLRNLNDYNDFDPKMASGKTLYTDIVNGGATWCSVNAWKVATDEQKKTLRENYGSPLPAKIAEVLQVYQEVNLKEKFRSCQMELVQTIWSKVAECSDALVPKKALLDLFNYCTEDHGLFWH